MKEKELIALHKRILGFSRKWNKNEDAEDMATEAIINRLEGKGKFQAPQLSAYDAKRKVSGSEDSPSYNLRHPLYFAFSDSYSDTDTALVREPIDLNDIQDERVIYYRTLLTFRDSLSDVHKFIFMLKNVYGFTNNEIGLILGCDFSNVSHMVQTIKRSLLRKFPEKIQQLK